MTLLPTYPTPPRLFFTDARGRKQVVDPRTILGVSFLPNRMGEIPPRVWLELNTGKRHRITSVNAMWMWTLIHEEAICA